MAIEIKGFSPDDYELYLNSLSERGVLTRALSTAQRREMLKVTEGSPLFTESLCRLLKYQSFEKATSEWVGAKGARVRAAALEREVGQLSPEAKRLLLAVALLSETSVPELGTVTEYPEETVRGGIEELNALFLVNQEAIAGVPRFRIPDNTVLLVLERKSQLVGDFRRIESAVARLRSESTILKSRDRRVAAAISQARALEGRGDITMAFQTIEDAERRSRRNEDLLAYHAELLMRRKPEMADMARRMAADAYKKGSRRPSLFDAWFTAEFEAKHFVGAEEVAAAAIEAGCRGKAEWLAKLALAKVYKAEARGLRGFDDGSIRALEEASNVLREAIDSSGGGDPKMWEGALFDVHDKLWELVGKDARTFDEIEVAVGVLERAWERRDDRFTNARRLVRLIATVKERMRILPVSSPDRQVARADKIVSRCECLIRKRLERYATDTRNKSLNEELAMVNQRVAREN